MKEITSTQNSLVKEICKLQQKKYREKYILIDGEKALEGAISSGLEIVHIFLLKEKSFYQKYDCYLVNEAVIKKLSTTDSPSSVVAVAKKPVYNFDEFKKFKKIALLDSIKDAGNLGTIIRAACAFDVDGIILFNDTVDEFSPKTIRASAGNMFKLPILKVTMEKLMELKKTHKFLATTVNSKNYFNEFEQNDEKLVIMFGSEADGLGDELVNIANYNLTIKMTKNVESLNLALCAGIVLYELQKNS